MSADADIGERPAPDATAPAGFVLRVEGFEGPLDLLLDLARTQRLDLGRISVLGLVDQYLAAVERAGRAHWMRLEQAADWLVMAAWLAWLKSRLLLPRGPAEAEEAERAARGLTDRLEALRQARDLATWLKERPQLGRDAWPRGAPGGLAVGLVDAGLPDLLQAWLHEPKPARAGASSAAWRPEPLPLWTAAQAEARMRGMLGGLEGRETLAAFLPPLREDLPRLPLRRRAALASTFVAALELARGAEVSLRQQDAFGEVVVVRP